MNRPIITIILAVLVLGVVLGYAARTYMLTQNITGFPGGQTSVWLLGQNATLSLPQGTSPPPVGANGSLVYPTKLTATCGGAVKCNITITITGLPTNWTLGVCTSIDTSPDGKIQHCSDRPYGQFYSSNGAQPFQISNAPESFNWYEVSYVNYHSTSLPGITVQYTWTA